MFDKRALVTCIHTLVVCVPREGKVMCTLSTLNYNTVQTFQEVLTVATETIIRCFEMFGTNNIVVSSNRCVILPALFWHVLAQVAGRL